MWEEDWVQTEADSNLCRREEIGLENAVVEDTERIHDHSVVLINRSLIDRVNEFRIRLDLIDSDSEVAKSG